MADDFGIVPFSIYNSQRVERLDDPVAILFFATIVAFTNDHGLSNGSARGVARLLGFDVSFVQAQFRALKDASLVDFYEVVAVDGVPYTVCEITGFESYPGQPKTRKVACHRRQSEWPLRDGSFPSYRGHEGEQTNGPTGGYRSDNNPSNPRTNRAPPANPSRDDREPDANQPRTKRENLPNRSNAEVPPTSTRDERAPTAHPARTNRAPSAPPRRELDQTQNETRSSPLTGAGIYIMSDQPSHEERARVGGAPPIGPGGGRAEPTQPEQRSTAIEEPTPETARAPTEWVPTTEAEKRYGIRHSTMVGFNALLRRHGRPAPYDLGEEEPPPPPPPPRPQIGVPVSKLNLRWPSDEHEEAALRVSQHLERYGLHRVAATMMRLSEYADAPDFVAKLDAVVAQGLSWPGMEAPESWDVLIALLKPPAAVHGNERPALEVLPGGAT